jgi:NADPH:quinone reductase-like Zn-dependent oxidoreductase
MRAVSISKYGEAFKVKTISKPSITAHNEILVKMKYAPINSSDVFYMKGVYGLRKPLPTTGGFEGCGIIEDAANHDLIGKKVSCWAEDSYNYGTWADYFLALEKNVIVYDDEHGHIDDKDFSKYCSPFVNPFTAVSFFDIA